MRDRPNQHEQSYLSEVARLDIPLRSVVNLRRVAEELRSPVLSVRCQRERIP